MKKILNMLLIVVLVLQTMTGSIVLPSFAAANDGEETIFKAVTITDAEGNEIGLDESAEQEVIVHVDWSVQGLEVGEGYQEALSLPDELIIAQNQTVELLIDEQVVGVTNVNVDQTVTVTFNEVIEEVPEAEGLFQFEAYFVPDSTEDEEAVDENAEESTESEIIEEDEEVAEADSEEADSSEEVTEDADEVEEAKVEDEDQEEESDLHSHSMSSMSSEITENIITGVTLKIDDVEVQNGDEIVVWHPYDSSNVLLEYDFALPNNHGYGDGSTFTISVPDMFIIPQVPASEHVPLSRSDGTIFGTFYTEGNEVIITFNENIENESDISGNISLESNFDEHYDGSAEGDRIVFPIEGEEDLEFPIKFIPNANAIDKQGVGNRSYNTQTITWTVDVNKNLQTIENATLDDQLTGEHSFIDGSLKVYELEMNANGEVDGVTEKTDHGFDLSFPIELGDIDSAYRFVYETEINDSDGNSYQNNATLVGDDMTPMPAEASVSVDRGKPLEKRSTGYNNVSQTITWEVRYNFDEKNISQEDAKLTDVFGDNQQLVEGSFEVVAVEINPDTGDEIGETPVSSDNYSIIETADGFELGFNDAINQAYKIVYQTTAIDRVDNNYTVENEISDEFGHSSEANRGISQGIFIKSHGTPNYKDKETNWSITINHDEHVMEDVVFTDTLPEGFTLEDIHVSHEGNEWEDGEQYSLDYNELTGLIEITFNQDLTKRVNIHYTTLIDFDEAGRGSHVNNAGLEWVPEGDDTSVSREASATFTPDGYTQNNGFKHGSYNLETKEITWTIGVNYNNETLNDVVVEDFIIGEQNFDIDDVKVYEMNLTSVANHYEIGDDVTEHYTISSTTREEESITQDGFQVLLGDITTAFVIQYTTDLNDQLVEASYDNEATVSSTNKDDFGLHTTVSPQYGGQFIDKSGQQNATNGRIVNWRMNLNFSQSSVANFDVHDTPSINQTILRDTLVVYETNVSGNSINKNEDSILEEGVDYTLVFSEDEDTGQESFTLTFNDEIDRAYVLEYDTYILYAGDGNAYGNTATIAGEIPGDEIESSDSTNTNISFNNISGTITGQVGSLQITKVDADDTELTLEGAVFELYDEAGEVLLRTGTTDETGVVTFNNLLYAEYQLREAEAPEGYVVGIEDTQTVSVNAAVTEIEVVNYEIKRHVELTKVDGTDGTLLEDVVFELWSASNDSIIDTYTTNADGVIYVEDLEPGDYYFIETTPADDYEANESQYPFTIEPEQLTIDQITVENELIHGSASIQKVDADNSTTGLEGAVFEVRTASGDLVRTITSDEDGVVDTGDLRPGDYQLVETEAPFGFSISNDEPIEFTIERETQRGTEDLLNLGTIANEVKTTSIELTKVDDVNGQVLAGAEFTLTYVSGEYSASSQTAETDEDGKVTFNNLKPGIYELRETSAPDGYLLSSEPIEVEVTLNDVDSGETVTTMTENSPSISVEVEKIWLDDNSPERPESINVTLLQNDDIFRQEEVTAEENWVYTFEDLPRYDENGVEYTYTIDEEEVDGYEKSIDDFKITNLRVGTIDVEGTKTWLDNNSDDRPTLIEVNLLQNGVQVDNQEVTAADNWQYSFTDLDEFDEEGIAYEYTVKEEAVTGYETTINGFDITNLRVGITSVDVKKEWLDGDSDDRPESITVHLLQNGDKYDETEVTAEENWEYTFTNLPRYDEQGVEYTYTIEEEEVAGYDSMIDGYEITNVRVGTIDVDVTKAWRDDNPADRPAEITVNLLRNGIVIETIEIDADMDWEHTFTDLAEFDSEGVAYEYRVTEHDVPGYHSEVEGFDITNTRSEEKSIVVTKGWLDDDSEDRPESITITLLQNGNAYETVNITEEDGWTYEFANLDAYDDAGQAIEYTVEEEPVEGYETTINGFDITNLRVDTTSVEGTKTWVGDTLEDRPDSIVVVLYQNGIEYEKKNVTRSDEWQYSFTDLPKFDESGVAYEYTISELDVDGYRSETDGYNLINTFIPIAPEEEEVQEVISDATEEDGEAQLPSTATNLFNIVLFGAGFIALGLLILMIARRQRKA
ncbi:Cna B-type domain-containing protein [Halalkalibacter sp. AB-rgal2]|uniref:Cna B-type domain-containing protein n=1 Tax=Halalkalibacter sp. AB-rgal2 TaxID=3242695 RepID=UPI00359CD37C